MGRVVVSGAIVLGNLVLYWLAFLVADRLFYGSMPRAVFMTTCFLGMGAVLRLWSKRWWMVIVPSAVGYLWGLGAVKWAIHFTDTRGEWAPPMARYVLSPSGTEMLLTLLATAAAGIGWWLASRFLPLPRGPAAREARV